MRQFERNIVSELKLTMVRDRKTSYSKVGLKKIFVLQGNSLNISSKEVDMKSFLFLLTFKLGFLKSGNKILMYAIFFKLFAACIYFLQYFSYEFMRNLKFEYNKNT